MASNFRSHFLTMPTTENWFETTWNCLLLLLFPIQKSFLNPFMFHVFEFTLNNSFTQLKIQREKDRKKILGLSVYTNFLRKSRISYDPFFLWTVIRISQTIERSLQTQRERMQCIGQCKCCLYRTTTDRERKRIESLDAVFGKSL